MEMRRLIDLGDRGLDGEGRKERLDEKVSGVCMGILSQNIDSERVDCLTVK
jgi:hypothetical protein